MVDDDVDLFIQAINSINSLENKTEFVECFLQFDSLEEIKELIKSHFETIFEMAEFIGQQMDYIRRIRSECALSIKFANNLISKLSGHFSQKDEVLDEFLVETRLNRLLSNLDEIQNLIQSQTAFNFTLPGNVKLNTATLPQFPRHIALIARHIHRIVGDFAQESKFLRRVLIVALNGGVPVDLFNFCKLPIDVFNEYSDFLGPEHFDRVDLYLDELKNVYRNESIEEELYQPIYNLSKYLTDESNERSLCFFFWNLVINIFFNDSVPNFRLDTEWPIRSFLPSANERIVDMVGLLNLGEGLEAAPILLVESGRNPFSWDIHHKDLSKMLCMMVACCNQFAYRLSAMKKRPEMARVYGLLIGGTMIQLCVAHPVISKVAGSNAYEIHSNVSFPKKWMFDLFVDPPRLASIGVSDYEKVLPPEVEISIVESANLSATGFQNEIIDLADVDRGNELPPNIGVNQREGEGHENGLETLKTAKAFTEIIKRRMASLCSESANDTTSGRTFKKPDGNLYLPASLGASHVTPAKNQIRESHEHESLPSPPSTHSPLGRSMVFELIKSSVFEMNVLKQFTMTAFASFFPRVYTIEELDDGKIRYEFEPMEPLYTPENGLSKIITGSRYWDENVRKLIKFTLDCLYGLHLLHDTFEILHCDISPNNIMFSNCDGIWKFIDFNSSLCKLRAKHNTYRSSPRGTPGFIAPECSGGRQFSEAADVFALGVVIYGFLYPFFYRVMEDEADFRSSSTLESIASEMCQPNLKLRKTVIDAMESTFLLAKNAIPDIYEDKVYRKVQEILEMKWEKENKLKNPEVPRIKAKIISKKQLISIQKTEIAASEAEIEKQASKSSHQLQI